MKEKVIRRKYDSAFKAEVLQMVFNGRPVSEVARSLGIGENIIYRWRSRHKASENKGKRTLLPPQITGHSTAASGSWRPSGIC